MNSAFFKVLGVLAGHQGFEVTEPSNSPENLEALISDTARSSHLGFRPISLEGLWYQGDVGSLLGELDGSAVALIPRQRGKGYVIARGSGSLEPLSDQEASRIEERAYEFYPSLGEFTSPGDLLRFALAGSRRTVATLLAAAVTIGLLGVLGPIAVNHVFGSVIPAGETDLLIATGLLLMGVALVSGAFSVVQGFAISRMSLKAQNRLQPAVWHRVVSLPASFFRRFPSGDLTTRVLGVNRLKALLSANVVGVLLAASFSLFNLVLILVFDPLLAAMAVLVVLAVVAVTWRFGLRIVALASKVVIQSRANDAHFSDVLEGLTAIRVSGSEDVFYRRHLDLVSEKVSAQVDQQRETNRLHLFYATVIVGIPGVFFLLVGWLQWDAASGTFGISSVTFVAFIAAFNTVLGAFMALSTLIQPLSTAAPIIDGISPILHAIPETSSEKADPGKLTGHIELADVSFRYPESKRQTVDGVSFTIEAGQFVALVGPSGAGKSTIVRLLLGFESADAGSVLYDGQSLEDHDVSAIRSQLGVVLQEARVFAGSIRENVTGARPNSLDEVWAAVDSAGLGDDIRAMSMGLETIVSPDGSTFSGGQLQRLMIARALIVKPKILILDEATSSLDDVTQEVVTENIDRLAVTRIVLAHRLSTIRNADQILVVDAGRLVEQGEYDDLIEANGLFNRLVERQVL